MYTSASICPHSPAEIHEPVERPFPSPSPTPAPPPPRNLTSTSLTCPPASSSCVVTQTNSTAFCQQCPKFCTTCTPRTPLSLHPSMHPYTIEVLLNKILPPRDHPALTFTLQCSDAATYHACWLMIRCILVWFLRDHLQPTPSAYLPSQCQSASLHAIAP